MTVRVHWIITCLSESSHCLLHFVNFNIGKNKNRFRLLNDLNIHQPFKNLYFLLKSELVLAHLRWNLKWAFLINFCLASVCPWVCLKINFFFTFSTFSKKKLLCQLQLNLAWLGKWNSSLLKRRVTHSSMGR